jgi:hypothetical protein
VRQRCFRLTQWHRRREALYPARSSVEQLAAGVAQPSARLQELSPGPAGSIATGIIITGGMDSAGIAHGAGDLIQCHIATAADKSLAAERRPIRAYQWQSASEGASCYPGRYSGSVLAMSRETTDVTTRPTSTSKLENARSRGCDGINEMGHASGGTEATTSRRQIAEDS